MDQTRIKKKGKAERGWRFLSLDLQLLTARRGEKIPCENILIKLLMIAVDNNS